MRIRIWWKEDGEEEFSTVLVRNEWPLRIYEGVNIPMEDEDHFYTLSGEVSNVCWNLNKGLDDDADMNVFLTDVTKREEDDEGFFFGDRMLN